MGAMAAVNILEAGWDDGMPYLRFRGEAMEVNAPFFYGDRAIPVIHLTVLSREKVEGVRVQTHPWLPTEPTFMRKSCH